MADSLLYLNIYVLGLPFVFFYNLSTGIFSALGDSRTPFWFLAASSTANIAVDILFVTVFHMGVSGVAWATFLCQGVSCVLALAVITRRLREIETAGRPARFDRVILQKFLRIAVPSVLQQSFISVGNIIIQSVINGFGGGVIAGYAAGVKLNNLVITSFTTLCNGISNYTAQNLGAGKRDRIRAGFRAGIKIVWLLSLPLFALYFFAGEPLIRFFIDQPSQTAVDTGVTYLRILSPFYFIISAKLVADGILRGAELMNQFMIGTFTDLILRVVLAVVLAKTSLGATGIWCAWPIGWCTAAVLSIRFCLTGPCKNGTSRPLG
jgi:Na+-driven multidrug efflux pump